MNDDVDGMPNKRPDARSDDRRPIAVRSSAWAQRLATWLTRTPITPNQISVISVIFAALGGALMFWRHDALALVGAAICVQLRLLCNLLDGMVAVEGGKGTALGKMYNELPDRLADAVLIVALGYTAQLAWVGWLGALAAMLTAYVRVFGGALGLAQDFGGLFAKQQRMFVVTIACIAGAIELHWDDQRYALAAGSALIAAGSIITCFTRTRAIATQLRAQG